MNAVKRTRLRSSGTRQAFASQLNILAGLLFRGFFPLCGRFFRLRRLLSRGRLRRGRCAGPALAAAALTRRLVSKDDDRASSVLDLRASRLRGAVDRHAELLRQLALPEDLHVRARVLDQTRAHERLGGHLGAVVEAIEVADVE